MSAIGPDGAHKGHALNHKDLYRLYGEERLIVRRRTLSDGRRFRILCSVSGTNSSQINNCGWVSSLSRSSSLPSAVIVDDEGIYDVREPNGRRLLGLKGTLSEAELSWFRHGAQAGLLSKARRGEIVLGLPVGYTKAADGRIDKHPDRRVQEAIAVVFRKFVEFGSARQVLLWLRQNEIRLPAASIAEGRELIWRMPVYQTIIKLLKNPIYADAYAFEHAETHTHVLEGRAYKVRGYRRAREQWTVLLRAHHDGYIGWDDYERNQRLLADNAQMMGLMVRGAARKGTSLLACLLRPMRAQTPHCIPGYLQSGIALSLPWRGAQSRPRLLYFLRWVARQ